MTPRYFLTEPDFRDLPSAKKAYQHKSQAYRAGIKRITQKIKLNFSYLSDYRRNETFRTEFLCLIAHQELEDI
jgi:hypothetical protein